LNHIIRALVGSFCFDEIVPKEFKSRTAMTRLATEERMKTIAKMIYSKKQGKIEGRFGDNSVF
jgi:hypothetical protein